MTEIHNAANAGDTQHPEASYSTPKPYWGPFPGETPELYERMGVWHVYKTIKPHFPKSLIGDFDLKKGRPRLANDDSEATQPAEELTKQEKLQNYVDWTKTNEKIHLGGLAVIAAMSSFMFHQQETLDNIAGAAFSVGNAAINVYPILLQRYNRLKAYRVLGTLTAKSDE